VQRHVCCKGLVCFELATPPLKRYRTFLIYSTEEITFFMEKNMEKMKFGEPKDTEPAANVLARVGHPLSIVSAFCLIVAGAIGLFYLLAYSHEALGWVLIVPVMLIAIGVIWLYLDFIDTTLTQRP
jgi:hypothetical protein